MKGGPGYHRPMPPLAGAFAAQLIGALIAAAIARLAPGQLFATPFGWALLQGGLAATVAYKLSAPSWWIPIHLLFLPLALLALHADLPPNWWLGAFLLLLMLFWRTGKDRVPLYLSNRRTAAQVLALLPDGPCRVLDLGCGTGSLVTYIARQRPDTMCVGVEHAPIPFLIAWWRSRQLHNLTIRYGDLWKQDLSPYQIVYAFLSPHPMPALWQKACREMRPGARLISNSFPIPGVVASSLATVADRRRTQLFCYSPADHAAGMILKSQDIGPL